MAEAEELVLRILGAVELVALVVNLLAIIYIFKSYIIRLKITSKFVLLFYGISLLLTVLIICQNVYNLFRDDYPPIFVDGPSMPTPNNIATSCIKLASALLGYCIVATMYKIGVSVQCILGKITPE